MGPKLMLSSVPMDNWASEQNAWTASRSESTITMSVTSVPIWKPHPAPPAPMADGALQEPFGVRAITRPDPTLALKKKPALITVRNAIPAHPCSSSIGMESSPSRGLLFVKFKSV